MLPDPKRQILFADDDPDDPDGPPILRSFDSLIDERFPPGSPERAGHDARLERLKRERRLVRRLTDWLLELPILRWEYAEPDVFDGEVIRHYHGLGHLASCFWDEVLTGLLHRRYYHSSEAWLLGTWSKTLDGLAFHYLDDAYVPTISDVRAGVAGRRQASCRRRHGAAIERAVATMGELRAAGLLDAEDASGTGN
jgi:hypothetical protein